MRPRPALLLLLLGLGPGLGRPPRPPAPRRALTAPRSAGGAPGVGERGSLAGLSLRPRAAPWDGVLSGHRGPCPPRGPACAPRRPCLRGLARRAPHRTPGRAAAPSHGDRHLRWLRRPEWTFRLSPVGPAAAASSGSLVPPRSIRPGGARPDAGMVTQTECSTDRPTPVVLDADNSSKPHAMASSVSCQLPADAPCAIHHVKINRDQEGAPLRLTRMMEATINVTVRYQCAFPQNIAEQWEVFSVPSIFDQPDWTKPLQVRGPRVGKSIREMYIPKNSLFWGVYVFNYSLTIITRNPKRPVVKGSDNIYVVVIKRPLEAVILGPSSIAVNFTDGLILNGTASSDPEAYEPLEGLQFFWYCTTNPGNYQGDKIVSGREVCLPEQADLTWTWASGPVLTLLPEMLKGDQVYFFRMVIQKGDRRAFSDKRVHVLRGPAPTATISCIKNCDTVLMTSDRFSLSLNCTNCVARHDFYEWSVLSPTGDEVTFDWVGQTTTGRNSAYLSIKAFAFQHFLEDQFWISLRLTAWSGVALVLRYSFIINCVPEIGECKINPAKGISFSTKFVVQCKNFKDKNIPLTYKIIVSDLHGFGEISSLTENTLGAILYLGNESTSPPSFLPVGAAADNYAMKIYAQVYDSLGAFSQVALYATVWAPTDKISPETVLQQLHVSTVGPNSSLSTLLQEQEFLPAGYLMFIAASILNSMKSRFTLQADKARLREHLVNQSFVLPVSTLEEISQAVMALTKLTQKASEFTPVSWQLATVRIWQANQALQQYPQKNKYLSSEQIETVSTGTLTSLSNILKLPARHHVADEPFYVLELLADTILSGKVPGNETTVMRSASFNMYVKKTEKWDVTKSFSNEKHSQNCFHPTLNVSSVPSLPESAPVSMMFCEFADDPFPWLNYPENSWAEVVGFRMTGTTANGDVVEITPDVAEVYLVRKNLSHAAFNLTVGPQDDGSLKMTTGRFLFEVDSRAVREVLAHIVTEVTVLFTVLVYAGREVTPTALVATFLVPHDIPPVANQSGLFDPACAVKQARVVCLPPSLLRVVAQRSRASESVITMVLQAPRFVMKPSDKIVRISLFSVHCLDMYGIQSDWREDNCALGEKTTWRRVHCVCKSPGRARRQLDAIKLASLRLHTHYLTAKVIVVPNPIDLRLEVIKNVTHNPVTLFTVLFIMFIYIVLAFWALHRNEMDQFFQEHVIILPDNDPYDNICYLVTVFTGSRWGSGTRANVFIQLRGSESTSDVHCLSHPHFTALYRGSINTFLLTTKGDLGDIHSVHVWHDNEGKGPSWYLSRIKVENLFSRQIWLFVCRKWLSVDTSVDRTFHVTHPDEPLKRKDFFLIDSTYTLRKNHMWFSIFAGAVPNQFGRLQRLSCCLAMLLSSLMCNIMFFNLNKKTEPEEARYVRSMVIGLESVFITIPVQLMITFLFTHSQREPLVTLCEVSPQKQPLVPEAGGHWEEHLEKWHTHETAKARHREAKPLPLQGKPGLRQPPAQAASQTRHQPQKAQSEVSCTHKANTNANNRNVKDNQGFQSAEPSSQPDASELQKPRTILPWWCVYIAWFLVFATSSVSSFFIVFYGLTYGYEKSIEWLFASFCSFCQSVFLVQPSKILLLSGFRTCKTKYCKDLSWVTKYRYTEIKLHSSQRSTDAMRRLHHHILQVRGSRMYQPLTEDEVRIFQRKKRLKRRALLFLSYILTHFTFLALLLTLVTLLRHTDSFHYDQFIRDQFSVELGTVTKREDIYSWLHSVLSPLFHNDLKPTFLPSSSSRILGLPLMRQVRAKPGEKICLPAKNFMQNSIEREIHCHPKYGADPEDTENYASFWHKVVRRAAGKNTAGFTYKPPEKKWVYYSHGLLHTYGSGGYAFYFFPDQQHFNSTLRLEELQTSNWLDENTWAVILELTAFNPDVNLFCSISVIFEVSQLGIVNTSISTHSFSLADFDRKTSAEIYLYVVILIFFLAYLMDEGYVILQEKASYVRSVYNLLNFALKCVFTVLIVLFLWKHFLATGIIQFYLSNSEDFIPFHVVSQVDHTMRIVLGFLLFLTILKTLRYSRFFYDVRLAQRAIQTALPGICHVALVVSVYFFVYTAFGYLVFGQHELNYSNLVHATQTIFSYCVPAFQNTDFSSNRVLGVLFLSSFLLVMICILINLFQAVILSAYEEMKQPMYEEPSDEAKAMTYLCHQLRTMFGFLSSSQARDEPEFFADMLYGQPEKNSHRYLGLKTRNINGKKMAYLVV